ncbi:MAG: hypothetical protein ACR2PW_07110 [Gammaproteobacteria bacterium]
MNVSADLQLNLRVVRRLLHSHPDTKLLLTALILYALAIAAALYTATSTFNSSLWEADVSELNLSDAQMQLHKLQLQSRQLEQQLQTAQKSTQSYPAAQLDPMHQFQQIVADLPIRLVWLQERNTSIRSASDRSPAHQPQKKSIEAEILSNFPTWLELRTRLAYHSIYPVREDAEQAWQTSKGQTQLHLIRIRGSYDYHP